LNVKKNPELTPELYTYVLEHNPPLDPVQRELVEITRDRLPHAAHLQVAEEQGPLLAFLIRLIGARQIVEIGTFTGFSALSMAQALPEDGTLITCDVSEEWTAIAREAWAKAGVADRIDLRIAPAIRTLGALPTGQWIDLAFIDADKGFYTDYWEELVPRIRPGGLIVADNTLYHGAVIDPETPGAVGAIRAFNEHVRADVRVDDVLLTVADGLTLARKR
jgi:caffeoyl-CoA O-methyltransferase